ncbi:phosphotyrosine protein phosphatase [Massilia arenosa]|uniref:Phosphotyrosine protein phosphatase n=1 Tax=Zemynaea arenosa TaxID=2561931 RepID=A0A4Y9RU71_9BURK|nr:low molecular weight protein tyrosine phosphatase family protein [Massilia arenosa]TFW10798.1 phosphotyrosine protein phosphatase [Massilia arenosa]
MTRALFICTQNRLRSPTAEQIFSTWPGVDTDSAGLGADATVPLSSEQIAWADIIFVMEKAHRNRLSVKFRAHLNGKRVICLDIPDEYEFMQPELIKLLEAKAGRFLRQPH